MKQNIEGKKELSNAMSEAMKAEREDALATLQRANDLLLNMFNLSTEEGEEEEETVTCSRCDTDVAESTSMRLGDAIFCELCWDDI